LAGFAQADDRAFAIALGNIGEGFLQDSPAGFIHIIGRVGQGFVVGGQFSGHDFLLVKV